MQRLFRLFQSLVFDLLFLAVAVVNLVTVFRICCRVAGSRRQGASRVVGKVANCYTSGCEDKTFPRD